MPTEGGSATMLAAIGITLLGIAIAMAGRLLPVLYDIGIMVGLLGAMGIVVWLLDLMVVRPRRD